MYEDASILLDIKLNFYNHEGERKLLERNYTHQGVISASSYSNDLTYLFMLGYRCQGNGLLFGTISFISETLCYMACQTMHCPNLFLFFFVNEIHIIMPLVLQKYNESYTTY